MIKPRQQMEHYKPRAYNSRLVAYMCSSRIQHLHSTCAENLRIHSFRASAYGLENCGPTTEHLLICEGTVHGSPTVYMMKCAQTLINCWMSALNAKVSAMIVLASDLLPPTRYSSSLSCLLPSGCGHTLGMQLTTSRQSREGLMDRGIGKLTNNNAQPKSHTSQVLKART